MLGQCKLAWQGDKGMLVYSRHRTTYRFFCGLVLVLVLPGMLQLGDLLNPAAWAQTTQKFECVTPLLPYYLPGPLAENGQPSPPIRLLHDSELQTAASQSGQMAARLLPVVDSVLSQQASVPQGQAGNLEATEKAFVQLGLEENSALLEDTVIKSLPTLVEGTNASDAIARLEAILPNPAASLQARQLSADFYVQAADATTRSLDIVKGRTLRERALAVTEPALNMLVEGGENNPALSLMAFQHYNTAQTLSRELAFSVAAQLEKLRLTLPDSVGRTAILFALGEHELMTNNNPGVAYLRYYDASKAYERRVAEGTLAHGGATTDRVSFEWAILNAKALASTDRDTEAVSLYGKLLQEYTPETAGRKYHDVWMQKAFS
jgi:hypothetical protein